MYLNVVYEIVTKLIRYRLDFFTFDGWDDIGSSFLWQVATGHSLNSPMWFNIVLLYITLLYYVIRKVLNEDCFDYAIAILAFCSYVIQFFGFYNCFASLGYELSYPLGRFVEMIPYASIGLLIYRSTFKRDRIYFLIFLLLAIITIRFIVLDRNTHYYGYGGIAKCLEATLLFLAFLKIPFTCLPNTLNKVILFLSKYSMGVYCMHILVGRILGLVNSNLSAWENSIIIYLVSLLLAYLISKIPVCALKKIVE